MWSEEVKARLLASKRIGQSTKVAVEVMDLTDALEEIERREAAIQSWKQAESSPECAACSVLDAVLHAKEVLND
jgi:hypothetical protein